MIPEYWQKIKNMAEDGIGDFGLPVLVILVGIASFGLGRLSALEDARPAVSIGQAASAALAVQPMAPGGMFVGARGGTIYYYPWCSGATKIAVASQVWFASEVVAQKAGYRAAKNCKGLTN
ncbi:hypothetical protein HY968_01485 [Candidatus Kaiserbacteria bacterium]|nr:hypothetical protein [Candidatus Kaiserbacteria bacterium]